MDDTSSDIGIEDSGVGVSIDTGTIGPEPAAPRKRKRRTRAEIDADNVGGGAEPRTGKTGGAKKEKPGALDLSSLTGMFIGLHMALAHATGVEELAVTPQEGEAFMTAAQNVARHYSVATTQKTLDWVAFAGCAAGIYAPRAVVLAQHVQAKKAREQMQRAPNFIPGDQQ